MSFVCVTSHIIGGASLSMVLRRVRPSPGGRFSRRTVLRWRSAFRTKSGAWRVLRFGKLKARRRHRIVVPSLIRARIVQYIRRWRGTGTLLVTPSVAWASRVSRHATRVRSTPSLAWPLRLSRHGPVCLSVRPSQKPAGQPDRALMSRSATLQWMGALLAS